MPETEATPLRFERGDASVDDLQAVADEVVAELAKEDSEASQAARAAGLDPRELDQVSVVVEQERKGVEPITTTILIAIAIKAGSHAAGKLWDDVVEPRVKKRLGVGAVGRRKPTADKDSGSR